MQDNKSEAVVSTIMELEKLYSNRITALEKALQQKDGMVKDLEEQNKNMVSQSAHFHTVSHQKTIKLALVG